MRHFLPVALVLLVPVTARAQLVQVASFGSNPGQLDMYKYVPDDAPDDAPLVVLLHGCSQQASGMNPTGFLELADEYHFYVVQPQQRSANNPVNCFNWAGEYGDPANLERGKGENQSIVQMIDKMKADHGVDPARVYIAGFSSGGAFAAVMMATWPELFAGGAVMSGVPYRCATTVQGAYDCMALGNHPERKKTSTQWGELVRAASDHDGAFPRVILFHGSSDTTVHPDNMTELIEQWTDVHGIDSEPSSTETIAGHQRTRFGGGEVEAWRIGGMVHAVSIGDDPDRPCGSAGAFASDKGLCAAYRAIRFFGLTGEEEPPPGGGGGGGGEEPGGAPTVSIVGPGDGEEVSGSVTIEANASDDGGVARVEFLVDGMLRGADASPPYTNIWQTANAGEGEHTVTAVAYDAFDNSSEASVTVEVLAGAGGAGDGLVDPISWGCGASGGGAPAGTAALLLLAFFTSVAGGRSKVRAMRGRLAFFLITGGLLVAARAAIGAPVRVDDFGANPGNLEMWAYSPPNAPERAPLLVVLHGCTQQASSMVPGGFESLADELGFHLLYPQQKSANNPVSCFNWAGEYGDPANLVRGQGENQSIASMVESMKSSRSIDPDRVHVIGFSAGGGMAAVLLATWPDVFASGAIAAGVPYRCATDQQGAFDCMNLSLHADRKRSPAAWGELVRTAHADWDGPWPRVMIVHGSADATVHPDAALELVEQWTNVHGTDAEADQTDEVDGHQRTRFARAGGTVVVESWRVNGMGHAFPIDPDQGCGQVAAFFEDRGLCGARRALDFFALGGGGGGGGGGDGDDERPDAGGATPPLGEDGGGGCSTGGGAGGGYALLLAAMAISMARRRRAGRSILPAPVRGSSSSA